MTVLRSGVAVDLAEHAARASAADAAVKVRELADLPDLESVVSLFSSVWGRDSNPPMTIELLRAFTKAGNYVAGAFHGDEMLGASVAFSSAERSSLHSHIAGVSSAARGRNVGFALKLHQRSWALARGFSEIAWTFDPLVSRNAYFNLVKLAASPVEYLPNFYGDMRDSINGEDASDRLLLHWQLEAPEVVAACAGHGVRSDARLELERGAVEALGVSPSGEPVSGDRRGPVALVAVPLDIEGMRVSHPALASRWRAAVRDALGELMSSGHRIIGYDRLGSYILRQERTRP